MPAPPDPLEFLQSLETFTGWDSDASLAPALQRLADHAELWSFSEGDLIRFPDEAPGGPTWVTEGCLAVEEEGAPTRYFGVREALTAPSGVWVKGKTSGRFVTVPEAAWREWLHRWSAAAQRLGEAVPPRLPRTLIQSPLVLEPGETPVQLFRKSRLFLGLRAALPGGFFVLFLAFGLVLQWGLDPRVPVWALWFLPGLGMVVTAALVGLVAWEWSTSMLAITDRSVIVRQVDVWAHRSDFEKLALERIREAVFSRQGWFDAALGLVNLEVEGDSPKGRLVFRGLARDSRFLSAMEAMRVRRAAAVPGRSVIRAALADRAGGAKAPRLERPAVKRVEAGPRVRRLSWRTETAAGIWFRRHPWFVVRKTLAWFGVLVLIGFLTWLAAVLWPPGLAFSLAAGGAAALVPLGRIAWEFWDWADDRLSVQGDRVVLVHRRPLWLGEVRQEGNLDQVEQVGVRKDNLAALLLDFGTVTVSLGASEPLVFDDASHPEWVQNEIFHRRTLLRQDREKSAARTRLDEVSEILDTWDEARKAGYFSPSKEAR
jgi:hypothetical protein